MMQSEVDGDLDYHHSKQSVDHRMLVVYGELKRAQH